MIVGAGSGFGAPKPVGSKRTYKVARGARGRHVACFVDAGNDGGYVTVGLANRAVRR
ncbi:MAG: hypothetical protein QOI73_3061 [Solirubrobacteraceae bacterium]|nr:hypothetical protein [Solirubrobacteraceae bacterium]